MKNEEVKKIDEQYVLQTYNRLSVCLSKGKGSWVWDVEGKKYLDFFPGWAVSGLGHCPPGVVNAIRDQAGKILHISNNFLNTKQIQLAQALSKSSFPAHVFFCNSGAEAIEGAIKFARKYGSKNGRFEVISMQQSFHGRTLAALTATGQDKIHKGFDPLPQGFRYAKLNDFASVEQQLTDKTVAILLEPIQGEGGIHVATDAFLKQLKELCQKRDLLLIFDEIQTGMGRTGKMFAFQHTEVVPDLMVLAKSLGGGLPIGALLVNNRLENVLTPGSHASTFGGNPVACAAALATLKTIQQKGLIKQAVTQGSYLKKKLEILKSKYPVIKEIRGKGLMLGMELTVDGKALVDDCRQHGLLINCTQDRVLRIMPALIVTKKEIDQALFILEKAIQKLK
jgi:predicted acetylornithine/succinylornithine family transaminase